MTWAVLIGVIYYFQWKLADAEEQEFVGATHRTDDFELAQPMGQMQQYMDKLHLAGLKGNWQLGVFYLADPASHESSVAHLGAICDMCSWEDMSKSSV